MTASLFLAESIHKVLPRTRFILISGSKKLSLLIGVEHVEPFRAGRQELLVIVVYPIETLLEVQELQVHSEGM